MPNCEASADKPQNMVKLEIHRYFTHTFVCNDTLQWIELNVKLICVNCLKEERGLKYMQFAQYIKRTEVS